MAAMTAKDPFAPVRLGPFPLAAMQCGCWPRQPDGLVGRKSRPSKKKKKTKETKEAEAQRREESQKCRRCLVVELSYRQNFERGSPTGIGHAFRNCSGRWWVRSAFQVLCARWSPLEMDSTAAVPLGERAGAGLVLALLVGWTAGDPP